MQEDNSKNQSVAIRHFVEEFTELIIATKKSELGNYIRETLSKKTR